MRWIGFATVLIWANALLAQQREWFIPHIPESQSWETSLVFNNDSTSQAAFEIQLFTAGVPTSFEVSAAPGAEVTWPVPSGSCGNVFCDQAAVSVRLIYKEQVQQGRADFLLDDALSKRLRFQLPKEEDTLWRGLAVMNPYSFAQELEFSALDSDGTVVAGTSLEVAGYQRWVGLVEDLFPGGVPSVTRIEVSAFYPLTGLMLSGLTNQQLLFLPGHSSGSPDLQRPLKNQFKTWFADYNASQGMDYLGAPFETFENGDPDRPGLPPHRYLRDIRYGPYERNNLDLWLPENASKMPLAIFIHGGAFVGGSKQSVPTGSLNALLGAGVAVASIHYRWAARSVDAALNMPIPNGEGSIHDVNGARLDYILRDCARAVQFMRYKAGTWQLDGARVACFGSSAGGGASMWIGTSPDMAVRNHPDPVLRESTRINGIGHLNSQVSYNWLIWPETLAMDPDFLFETVTDNQRVLQFSLDDQIYNSEGMALSNLMDYYRHLSIDDPAVFTLNQNPDLEENQIQDSSEIIHHPRGHAAIYDRCNDIGIPCSIRTEIVMDSAYQSVNEFLLAVLLPDSAVLSAKANPFKILPTWSGDGASLLQDEKGKLTH